jgi:hypothetical protein
MEKQLPNKQLILADTTETEFQDVQVLHARGEE